MDSLYFCYWLQGYCEVHGQPPTTDEWNIIKDHLQLVFKKVTPDYTKLDIPIRPLDYTPIKPIELKPPYIAIC